MRFGYTSPRSRVSHLVPSGWSTSLCGQSMRHYTTIATDRVCYRCAALKEDD